MIDIMNTPHTKQDDEIYERYCMSRIMRRVNHTAHCDLANRERGKK